MHVIALGFLCSVPPRPPSSSSFSCQIDTSARRVPRSLKQNLNRNLRRLTSRIVELKRRRQLDQIFAEVEVARRRHGNLNTIVMNAVMDACVHCGNIGAARWVFDEMSKPGGCGADGISFSIFLKGLGQSGRVDEAFQMLESLEKDAGTGCPQLSARLIYGLLDSLLEAGDLRRANGLVARYRPILHVEGQSLMLYNLLIKGYSNSDFPLGALTVRDEILRHGLKPDKLTYNSLVHACVKSGRIDIATQLLTEMKVPSKYLEEAEKSKSLELMPDVITYTTLLKGLESNKDLVSIMKIVLEMKLLPDLTIDRIAYTAIVDAFLACGSISDALCIFGEMIKRTDLRPKPHLYLSIMRTFATRGDFQMVKRLHARIWTDSVGAISQLAKAEADELLMEAAVNDNQVDFAKMILSKIISRGEEFSWTTRGGMVAVKVEVLSGFRSPILSPYILPRVSVDDPVEKYMTAFDEADPLPGNLTLEKVVMRFFQDSAIPVIDDWGSCIGIVHRIDCDKFDAPLSTMTRGPPPCVTTLTSIGRVIDLVLEKKHEMVVIVKNSDVYETSYSSNSRPVGVFTLAKFFKMIMGTTTPENFSFLKSLQHKAYARSRLK